MGADLTCPRAAQGPCTHKRGNIQTHRVAAAAAATTAFLTAATAATTTAGTTPAAFFVRPRGEQNRAIFSLPILSFVSLQATDCAKRWEKSAKGLFLSLYIMGTEA